MTLSESQSTTANMSGPSTPREYTYEEEESDDDMEKPQLIGSTDIPTLAEAYECGLLKAPWTPDKESDHQPNLILLDRVSLFQGDITKLNIDAIVNAANRSLLGGGGVDGAIHAAAGHKLKEECMTLNGCSTGDSKITKGYSLPARYVIHTVGPIYIAGFKEEKAEQLASCYSTSLALAAENELRHIAFPSISTGLYAYPIDDATRIALTTTRTFLESEQGSKIERVIFVVWSDRDRAAYESIIPEIFPPVAKEVPQDGMDAELD